METIKMQLNSPITDEQWNIITDAELEHSDEIEFTTPSGKKVMYAKVRHGKWIKMSDAEGYYYACSECGEELTRIQSFDPQFDLFPKLESINKTQFCPNCGAKMDEVKE